MYQRVKCINKKSALYGMQGTVMPDEEGTLAARKDPVVRVNVDKRGPMVFSVADLEEVSP